MLVTGSESINFIDFQGPLMGKNYSAFQEVKSRAITLISKVTHKKIISVTSAPKQ